MKLAKVSNDVKPDGSDLTFESIGKLLTPKLKRVATGGPIPKLMQTDDSKVDEKPYFPLPKAMFKLELEFMVACQPESFGKVIDECNIQMEKVTGTEARLKVLAKRCNAYLHLRCYNRALEDANRIIEIRPLSQIGIYYKVKSIFGLEEYEKLHDLASKWENNYALYENGTATWKTKSFYVKPNEVNIGMLLQHALVYIRQNMFGIYDMKTFVNLSSLNYRECSNYARFLRFTIDRTASEGRRKWFLTARKHFKKGELIIAAKPLNIVYKRVTNAQDEIRRFTDFGEQQMAESLRYLYGSPHYSDTREPPLVVSKRTGHPPLTEDQFRHVSKINGFGKTYRPTSHFCSKDGGLNIVSGLWYLPSFLKHSCWNYNCSWMVHQSVLFVRALKDIEPGEFFTIPYFDPLYYTYFEKQALMQEFCIETCTCDICENDKLDSKTLHEQRSFLQTQLRSDSKLKSVKEAIPVNCELQKTIEQGKRSDTLYMVIPLVKTAFKLYEEKKHFLSVQMYLKAYDTLANRRLIITSPAPCVHEINLDISYGILLNYVEMDDYNIVEIREWMRFLKRDAATLFGYKCNASSILKFKSAAATISGFQIDDVLRERMTELIDNLRERKGIYF